MGPSRGRPGEPAAVILTREFTDVRKGHRGGTFPAAMSHYLQKHLNAVSDVILGPVDVILQEVEETQLLAVAELEQGPPQLRGHRLVHEGQQGLVALPTEQGLEPAADHVWQAGLLRSENLITTASLVSSYRSRCQSDGA